MEGSDIEEDRFVVEEEFGEKREVLAEQLATASAESSLFSMPILPGTHLILFPVNLVDHVVTFHIDQLARRRFNTSMA